MSTHSVLALAAAGLLGASFMLPTAATAGSRGMPVGRQAMPIARPPAPAISKPASFATLARSSAGTQTAGIAQWRAQAMHVRAASLGAVKPAGTPALIQIQASHPTVSGITPFPASVSGIKPSYLVKGGPINATSPAGRSSNPAPTPAINLVGPGVGTRPGGNPASTGTVPPVGGPLPPGNGSKTLTGTATSNTPINNIISSTRSGTGVGTIPPGNGSKTLTGTATSNAPIHNIISITGSGTGIGTLPPGNGSNTLTGTRIGQTGGTSITLPPWHPVTNPVRPDGTSGTNSGYPRKWPVWPKLIGGIADPPGGNSGLSVGGVLGPVIGGNGIGTIVPDPSDPNNNNVGVKCYPNPAPSPNFTLDASGARGPNCNAWDYSRTCNLKAKPLPWTDSDGNVHNDSLDPDGHEWTCIPSEFVTGIPSSGPNRGYRCRNPDVNADGTCSNFSYWGDGRPQACNIATQPRGTEYWSNDTWVCTPGPTDQQFQVCGTAISFALHESEAQAEADCRRVFAGS